ncbi:MAG: nuclear transport factor 2 family protein [Bdellovibrionales bacterium]
MSSCCSGACCCSNQNTPEMEEVKEALNVWLKAVASGGPDGVMTLYMDNAVLLPTLSGVVCDTPAKRLDYFKVFTANENLQGTIDEIHTRVYGDIAINTGHYTFTFKKDGQDVTAPARFSFVYKKTQLGWMIVDHHSSLVPAGH